MRLTGIVRRLGCPASARMLADLAPFAVDPRGRPRFKSLATMDATGFEIASHAGPPICLQMSMSIPVEIFRNSAATRSRYAIISAILPETSGNSAAMSSSPRRSVESTANQIVDFGRAHRAGLDHLE